MRKGHISHWDTQVDNNSINIQEYSVQEFGFSLASLIISDVAI